MTKPKRDRDYYLQRLKKDRPDLYRGVRDGKLSVNKARQLAGLGGRRTRLNELQNAWKKATTLEQSQFLSWAGIAGTPPTSLPPTGGSAFDGDGKMLGWARRRIPEIMQRRNISSGDLATELGLKKLDGSVMSAVRRDVRLDASTAAEVDRWLLKHASI